MTGVENKYKKRVLDVTLLDDIEAHFVTEQPREEYVVSESISVLDREVGKIDTVSPLTTTLETIDTLEESIDSVVPKVPIVVDDSIKKIKIDVKKKMAKKTVREELKEVQPDEVPELANLENTLVLNAAILKQELEKSKQKELKAHTNRMGRNIMIALYAVLVIFSLVLPFLVEYVF